MKLTAKIRLEFEGYQVRWRPSSFWNEFIVFRGTLNPSSRPSRGDDLYMLIFRGEVGDRKVDVTHLKVTEVGEQLEPEADKRGVYVPSLWVSYSNVGQPILKGVTKHEGLTWVDNTIIPRMKLFGFEVAFKSFHKTTSFGYV